MHMKTAINISLIHLDIKIEIAKSNIKVKIII
jgi:hypothetical protein